MTTYRLFPATSGPSNAVSFGSSFISGVIFEVTASGMWFEGYWWWVAPGSGGSPVPGSTSPRKCALWSVTGQGAGTVIPASVVTSGTLTAGQWNFIPLATPVQLSIGSPYIAAVGVNGNFPDTNNSFGTAGPYIGGITNGPLTAWSDASGEGGTLPPPYSNRQGLFSTAGSDPSTTMPNQGDSTSDNFWVDVQVSTIGPGSYSGTYRLWPNKWDANPQTGGDSKFNYTIATELYLTGPCTLNNIWYFSPSGATELATRADVWSISSGLSIASITSPSWSGSAGSGWLSAAFAGGTTLPAGSYRVSVYCANGTSGVWGAKDATTGYWATGTGSGGITWGPVYAPPLSAASLCWEYNESDEGATPPYSNGAQEPGQSPFGQLTGDSSGGVTFPQLYVDGLAQNYWIDLEVTPEGTAHTASASLSVVPVLSAGRSAGRVRSALLAVTPSFLAGRARGQHRTASLTVTPELTAAGTNVVPPPPPAPAGAKPATGAWWGLDAILKTREEEFEAWESIVQASGGLACPVCGEPLQTGPPSAAGTVTAYCPYAGDHKYRVPRDVVPPRRGVKMGRFG